MKPNLRLNAIKRVWRSTGPFTEFGHGICRKGRIALGVIKAIDLALTPIHPKGILLEKLRAGLFGRLHITIPSTESIPKIAYLLKLRDQDFTPALTTRKGDLDSFARNIHKTGRWFIAKRGDLIVGAAYLIEEDGTCRFGSVVGHPQLGKGVGEKLIKRMLEAVKYKGKNKLTCHSPSNSPIIPVIKKFGVQETGRIKNARGPGIDEISWEIPLKQ